MHVAPVQHVVDRAARARAARHGDVTRVARIHEGTFEHALRVLALVAGVAGVAVQLALGRRSTRAPRRRRLNRARQREVADHSNFGSCLARANHVCFSGRQRRRRSSSRRRISRQLAGAVASNQPAVPAALPVSGRAVPLQPVVSVSAFFFRIQNARVVAELVHLSNFVPRRIILTFAAISHTAHACSLLTCFIKLIIIIRQSSAIIIVRSPVRIRHTVARMRSCLFIESQLLFLAVVQLLAENFALAVLLVAGESFRRRRVPLTTSGGHAELYLAVGGRLARNRVGRN